MLLRFLLLHLVSMTRNCVQKLFERSRRTWLDKSGPCWLTRNGPIRSKKGESTISNVAIEIRFVYLASAAWNRVSAVLLIPIWEGRDICQSTGLQNG